MLGLLPSQYGGIYWNGTLVEDPAVFFRPDLCAYTPQEVRLLSGTVRENILLGEPCDDQRLEKSLWRAGLDADVDCRSAGMDRTIGAGGQGLSGGQVQRVGLARMFYRRAELLVLDDPSSALDKATEQRFWERLSQSPASETYLIATNRVEIMRRAQRVVVLNAGRIVESGTYAELLPASDFLKSLDRSPGSDRSG
jgi:ABC-type multidrug transport system fused ATPase/permease subunit